MAAASSPIWRVSQYHTLRCSAFMVNSQTVLPSMAVNTEFPPVLIPLPPQETAASVQEIRGVKGKAALVDDSGTGYWSRVGCISFRDLAKEAGRKPACATALAPAWVPEIALLVRHFDDIGAGMRVEMLFVDVVVKN